MHPSACRAFVAVLAVGVAFGGGRAFAEGEGKRFSVHPSIKVTTVADDNVRLQDGDRDSDIGVWIAPRLELGYQSRGLQAGADLGADVRRYLNHSHLGKEFYRLHGFVEVGLLPGLTLRVSDTYTPQPIRLGVPEDEGRNLVQTNRVVTKLEYWREFAEGREVQFGIQGGRLTSEGFEEGRNTGSGGTGGARADHWDGAAYAEVSNPLGRKSSVFLRAQSRYRTFDESSEFDFVEVFGVGGIRSRWLRNVEVSLSGGYGLVEYLEQSSTKRFLADGRILWRLPRGWSTHLNVHNKFTADLTGRDYVETAGTFGVEKRLGPRTDFLVEGFLTRFDGDSFSEGSSLFGGVRARVRRQLTRRVQFALTYRHWNRGGGEDIDDFYQNRLSLMLSYRR